MDYSKAFSYFTKDKDWLTKYVIGALLAIIPIVNFFVGGYILRVIDVMPNQEELPQWENWGDLFKNGFFLFVVFFVYYIPVLLIFLGLLVTTIPAILTSSQGANFNLAPFVPLLIIGALFVLIYLIILSFLTPAITLIYNKTKSIGDALKINDVVKITKTYFGNIAPVVVIMWAISIGVGFVSFIPILGSLIAIALGFYPKLVYGHLYGQLDKIIYPTVQVNSIDT